MTPGAKCDDAGVDGDADADAIVCRLLLVWLMPIALDGGRVGDWSGWLSGVDAKEKAGIQLSQATCMHACRDSQPSRRACLPACMPYFIAGVLCCGECDLFIVTTLLSNSINNNTNNTTHCM